MTRHSGSWCSGLILGPGCYAQRIAVVRVGVAVASPFAQVG